MRRWQDWLAGALAVLIILGMPGAIYAYQQHATAGVITIHAHQWGYTPGAITVPAGQPVRLHVVSDDVIHGFSLPDLDINVTELYPGHPVDLTIPAPAPGKYLFYCITYCGVDHPKMRAYLLVQ